MSSFARSWFFVNKVIQQLIVLGPMIAAVPYLFTMSSVLVNSIVCMSGSHRG